MELSKRQLADIALRLAAVSTTNCDARGPAHDRFWDEDDALKSADVV